MRGVDWKVTVQPAWDDGGDRVFLHAAAGEQTVLWVGNDPDTGHAIFHSHHPGVELADTTLRSVPRLERGMLLAIAEYVKPGPPSGEVKRLEDALAVERARVDKMIAWATTQMIPR